MAELRRLRHPAEARVHPRLVAGTAAVDQPGGAGGPEPGVVEVLEDRLPRTAQVRHVHVVDRVVEGADDPERAGRLERRAVFHVALLAAVVPVHRGDEVLGGAHAGGDAGGRYRGDRGEGGDAVAHVGAAVQQRLQRRRAALLDRLVEHRRLHRVDHGEDQLARSRHRYLSDAEAGVLAVLGPARPSPAAAGSPRARGRPVAERGSRPGRAAARRPPRRGRAAPPRPRRAAEPLARTAPRGLPRPGARRAGRRSVPARPRRPRRPASPRTGARPAPRRWRASPAPRGDGQGPNVRPRTAAGRARRRPAGSPATPGTASRTRRSRSAGRRAPWRRREGWVGTAVRPSRRPVRRPARCPHRG